MSAEKLMIEYGERVRIMEVKGMPPGLGGIYMDNVIRIDKNRHSYEKHCILAEEIGHFETTYGDITNFKKMKNWKVELVARRWSYEKVVSLDDLIHCYENHLTTIEDVCTYLEVPADFLKTSLDHYLSIHGLSIKYKGYLITFDPLNVHKL